MTKRSTLIREIRGWWTTMQVRAKRKCRWYTKMVVCLLVDERCENSDLGGASLFCEVFEELMLVAETRAASLELVVTWLILPVVICLSQRLSHACLSINKFVLWNCEWLIKSVIVYLMISFYMDNCGKLELIHATKAPTSGRGVFIR